MPVLDAVPDDGLRVVRGLVGELQGARVAAVQLVESVVVVLAYLDEMHAEAIAIIGSLGPEELRGKCRTVGGADLTVWKWLRLMVEHEIHHRGQLYEVLGLAGVATPPLYGLTEPEVRDASQG